MDNSKKEAECIKIKVLNEQEKTQSERDSHSKNRSGENLDQLANLHSDTLRDLASLP